MPVGQIGVQGKFSQSIAATVCVERFDAEWTDLQ